MLYNQVNITVCGGDAVWVLWASKLAAVHPDSFWVMGPRQAPCKGHMFPPDEGQWVSPGGVVIASAYAHTYTCSPLCRQTKHAAVRPITRQMLQMCTAKEMDK